MKKYLVLVTAFMVTALSLPVLSVRAYDSDSSRRDSETERSASPVATSTVKSENRKSGVLEKCEVVEGKLKTRIDAQTKRKTTHSERYTELQNKLSNIVASAKALGYDTVLLEEQQATLIAKIKAFQIEKASYDAALANTQSYVCGKSKGEFLTSLATARLKLKQLRLDAKAIHEYVKDTVKPTLQALKKAKAEATGTQTTED